MDFPYYYAENDSILMNSEIKQKWDHPYGNFSVVIPEMKPIFDELDLGIMYTETGSTMLSITTSNEIFCQICDQNGISYELTVYDRRTLMDYARYDEHVYSFFSDSLDEKTIISNGNKIPGYSNTIIILCSLAVLMSISKIRFQKS